MNIQTLVNLNDEALTMMDDLVRVLGKNALLSDLEISLNNTRNILIREQEGA